MSGAVTVLSLSSDGVCNCAWVNGPAQPRHKWQPQKWNSTHYKLQNHGGDILPDSTKCIIRLISIPRPLHPK